MCGLVGVAGDLLQKHTKAFADLLIFNQVRGMHSTGIASINRDGSADVLKRTGTPDILLDNKHWDRYVNPAKIALIGHGRHATVGNVNYNNAHPFDFDNIVGAHNGTLMGNWRSKIGDHHGTDSENLYAHMNVAGVEQTIPQLQGAWALTWWDKQEKVLSFLRNKDRPLCYVMTEDNKVMFWASEPYFLHAALARNDIKYDKVFWFPEDVLYEWKIPQIGRPFEEPDTCRVEGDPNPFRVAATHTTAGGTGVSGTSLTRTWTEEDWERWTAEWEEGERKEKESAKQTVPPFDLDKLIGPVSPGIFSPRRELIIADGSGSLKEKKGESKPGSTSQTSEKIGKLGNDSSKTSSKSNKTSGGSETNVVPLNTNVRRLYKNWRGFWMTPEQTRELIKDGCEGCGDPMQVGDNITFLKGGPVCEGCVKDDDIMTVLKCIG